MSPEARDILLWNLGIESATTLRLSPSPHTLLTLQDTFHDHRLQKRRNRTNLVSQDNPCPVRRDGDVPDPREAAYQIKGLETTCVILSDHLVLGKAISSTGDKNSTDHRSSGTKNDTVRPAKPTTKVDCPM